MCALKRAIYGLKVSPQRGFIRFEEAMQKIGFTCYPFQSCLFTSRQGSCFAMLLLCVDDILLGTNDKAELEEINENLVNEFEMKNLGEPHEFLGIER